MTAGIGFAGGQTRGSRLSPGVVILAGLAIANIGIWFAARPDGIAGKQFAGEVCGAEAVLLFSISLALSTLLPPVEKAFGGLDRVVAWHRRCAVAGLAVLAGHRLLVTASGDPFASSAGKALGSIALAGIVLLSLWALAPRLRGARYPGPVRRLAQTTYEKWLGGHRLMGLFVAAAIAHGLIVDPALHRSTLLRAVFLIVGITGIAAYLYRELLSRWFLPIHNYTTDAITPVSDTTLAVTLKPDGKPLAFTPGQFVVVEFGGRNAWQRHPFSVSSAPGDAELEVTVKALGDYTNALRERVQPGVPARVVGPFGSFDYRLGGHDQIWIAGGVGVTPFLSWMRSLDGAFDRDVDFYYSVRRPSEAIDVDELEAIARAHPTLRLHIVAADSHGLLTADEVLADAAANAQPWVYMCGPSQMMRAFAGRLRKLGIPGDHVRFEQFSFREP